MIFFVGQLDKTACGHFFKKKEEPFAGADPGF